MIMQKRQVLLRLAPAFIFAGLVCMAQAQQAETEIPKPAVVVIRHGEDLDVWIKGTDTNNEGMTNWKAVVPDWPNYTTSAGDFTVPQHGLSATGEEQALFLGENLQRLMKWAGCESITRVITKKPYGKNEKGEDPTPNPFDTIYPFLQVRNSEDAANPKPNELILIAPGKEQSNPLLDRDLVAMLPNEFSKPPKMSNTLLRDQGSGSTLLCWDAEGLWGEAVGEKPNRTRPFDPNSILRMMGGYTMGNYFKDEPKEAGGGCPDKAARLYIFTRRPETGTSEIPQKFNCEVIDLKKNDNGEFAFYEVAKLSVKENAQELQIIRPKAYSTQEILLPSP